MSAIDRFASAVASRSLEAIETADRSTRTLGVIAGILTTLSIWWVDLKTPSLLFNHHEPLQELVYVLLRAPPFVAVVSLGYVLFPSLEKITGTGSGPISGYLQIEKSEKRWKIIVAAGAVSVANLLCMMFSNHHV